MTQPPPESGYPPPGQNQPPDPYSPPQAPYDPFSAPQAPYPPTTPYPPSPPPAYGPPPSAPPAYGPASTPPGYGPASAPPAYGAPPQSAPPVQYSPGQYTPSPPQYSEPYTQPMGAQPPPYQPDPYAPYQGGQYPPAYMAPKSGTNGFAIASLITGICGFVLLSVIFGFVGLAQTKKTGQKGRGLAIGGLVLSGLWIVGIATAVIIVNLLGPTTNPPGGGIGLGTNTSTTDPDPTTPPGPRKVALEDLRAGDCVDGLKAEELVSGLTVLPCTSPHDGEVYAVFNLTGTTFPGQTQSDQLAEDGCGDRLDAYSPSANDDDNIGLFYFSPTDSTWTAGDKSVICIAKGEKTKLTKSIRGV